MKKNGFTLIEMVVVMLLIGIISLIAVPLYNSIINDSKESSYRSSMLSIIKELESYVINNSGTSDFSNPIDLTTINLNISAEEKYVSGSFYRYNNFIVLVDVTDGDYCASGNKNDLKIEKGSC